ncbi:F-box protein PP2-B10 [Spatholobus suberectus]|nr:F-box protein PP2-B10 [Spatholobus suberectus]
MLSARSLFIIWGDTPTYWQWTSVAAARVEEVAELVSVCWLEIKGGIKTGMLLPNTLYAAYLVFKQQSAGAHGFENQAVEALVQIVGEGDGQRRTVYLETPPRPLLQIFPPEFNFSCSCFRNSPDAEKLSLVASPSGLGVHRYPKKRSDGWMEVEVGDFFSGDGEDKEVEMSVYEVKGGHWKGGILVEAIEIRPKGKT